MLTVPLDWFDQRNMSLSARSLRALEEVEVGAQSLRALSEGISDT
jgi:hypothetical protein